jgi:hypothetical protein
VGNFIVVWGMMPLLMDALINFVNSHFVAKMPRFEREGNQNVFQASNVPIYTNEYKQKAIDLVQMHAQMRSSRKWV